MKKPPYDELELQLQEYTWQSGVASDRHIECMTASIVEVEFADTWEDTPEYRH